MGAFVGFMILFPHMIFIFLLQAFFCVLIGAWALGNAFPNLQKAAEARGAAYSLYKIIDDAPSIDTSSDAGIKPDKLEGYIEFKNVKFSYPSREDVQVREQ